MSEEQGLKDAGLKITAPRLKILQLLESTSVRHVSAEDVYKLLLENGEEIGLATVYRVLTQFEDAGLVARHSTVWCSRPSSAHPTPRACQTQLSTTP